MQEVLFDAVVTAPMEAYWTALALNASEYVQAGAEGPRRERGPGPCVPLAESRSPRHELAGSLGNHPSPLAYDEL